MDPQLIFASATSAVIAGGFVWAIMSAHLKAVRAQHQIAYDWLHKQYNDYVHVSREAAQKSKNKIAELEPLAKLTLDRRARERRYHANRTAAKRGIPIEQAADA